MALQRVDAALVRVPWSNVCVPCSCLMSLNPSNPSDVLVWLMALDWPMLNVLEWPTLSRRRLSPMPCVVWVRAFLVLQKKHRPQAGYQSVKVYRKLHKNE